MMKHRQAGFSLVELSVALLALGLVLLGAVVYWQFQERQRVGTAQMAAQLQARDALVGFAHAQHRLPCPATDANGVESCAAGTGLRQVGYVPWQTLGLPRPEAGRLRYGVYREASATAAGDRDLAVALDRMNPLRALTPNPRPQNGDGPNPNMPPIPSLATVQLGATEASSGTDPLNAACSAANSPPCPVGGAQSVNQIDLCLALNTSTDAFAGPAGRLAVSASGSRRAVAFAIAAPGMLDADGNGLAFDGLNASVSDADPTFAAPRTPISDAYDDQVIAMSAAELFSELRCGGALSAASHAHFNAATGALVMERAMYDYRDQLYVAIKLAEADVAASAAGIAGAASAVADSIKEMMSAVGDTTQSAGARSFQIGLAAAGIATAAVGTAAAIATVVLAADALSSAEQDHADFASRTTAATDLSISVNRNALRADAIGF